MTKKRLVFVMSVLALIAILGVAAGSTVLAQTTTPPAESTPATPKAGRIWSRGFGFGGDAATFDAVAEALKLTPTQLFEELHAGKTLSAIAEAQGVDLSAVQEAMNASRIQAMKEKIAQAVTDGKITQEQADWLLQGIEKGWAFRGRGFGIEGFGLDGRGGMKGMRGHPFGEKGGSLPAPSTSARGTSG